MLAKTARITTTARRVSTRRGLAKSLRKSWQLTAMLLLPAFFVLLFSYVPMYGAHIAFKDFSTIKGFAGSPWVGLDHFRAFLALPNFGKLMINTLLLNIESLIFGFPFPILLALCLNQLRAERYKKLIQTVTYMPNFISVVVIVGIIKQLLNPTSGLLNRFIELAGGSTVDFFGRPDYFRPLYILSGIWQGMGWGSIIYFAALTSVDPQLHEAALIDGASRFRRTVSIDLPAILPTIIISFILNLGNMARTGIDKVLLMQSPLNQRTSEVIDTYVYKIGIASKGGQLGYATAVGLFQSLIGFGLILFFNQLSKKVTDTSLW